MFKPVILLVNDFSESSYFGSISFSSFVEATLVGVDDKKHWCARLVWRAVEGGTSTKLAVLGAKNKVTKSQNDTTASTLNVMKLLRAIPAQYCTG